MKRKVAVSTLNASTIDILNTIRANASYEYQSSVPVVTTEHDIPAVGEILYGYPALANQFINALVNRIALVRVKSAIFNNPYKDLKKGILEYGDTIENVFVEIAKAREFSAEKAESRELKRTLPDVKSAFAVSNWFVQYPVTIEDIQLKRAFTSMDGVQDLIAKIVDSVYTAAEYDEYLLFKYLIIKSVAHGKMYPVQLGSTMNDAAIAFRGASNKLQFIDSKYNAAGVHTATPKEDQYIFMDADFNASYDVSVLAAAFNMDKAEFMGKLKLIDSFTTFDNDRFDVIRANSDQLEEVTAAELALMADVKAVLVDGEWFQVYDNVTKFTETYVASGMYWNYFLNIRKTIASSPFSNAIVFVGANASAGDPATLTFKVGSVSTDNNSAVYTLEIDSATGLGPQNYRFIQDETAVEASIAVHPYGAFIMPEDASAYTAKLACGSSTYTAGTALTPGTTEAGATIVFTKD